MNNEAPVDWFKLSLLVSIIFLPFQVMNSLSTNDAKFHRNFASIVLLQDIQDIPTSAALYPDSLRLKNLSQILIKKERSIFNSRFKEKYDLTKLDVKNFANIPKCLGFIDGIRATTDEGGFIVSGWVTLPTSRSIPNDLIAVNANNQVIGVGIAGLTRKDVAKQVGSWAEKSGFNLVTRQNPVRVFAFDASAVSCFMEPGPKTN